MMKHASCLLLLLALAAPAQAQLRLPGLPGLPNLPNLPNLPGGQPLPLPQPAQQTLDTALAPANLVTQRADRIDELLRRHPRELQRDPRGEPVLRGELLAAPSGPALRERIFGEGFVLLREQALAGLDLAWLVLQPPARLPLEHALAWLRAVDPAGHYDYHHLYTGSGGPATGVAASAAAAGTGAAPARIGLIDAGVDPRHPALRAAAIRHHGCNGAQQPSAHGTAVASLLVGQAGAFRGAQPAAGLWAADVVCNAATGGSVQAIAQALAWLAGEQVAVINISLVGPPNALLERAVAALVARGHLLVAAVGNDGPAAAALYPAAWPGVVAVTATDARRRVLPEAGRGPHVAFAAPGADLAAASLGGRAYEVVRGTSFAAPLVAGLLAAHLRSPDPAAAQHAVAALAAQALDLGAGGRDPLYGHGLVGEALRVEPARLAGLR